MGAKIEEEANNGYLTRWTPRFSKALKMKIRWEITSSKFFIFSKDDVMAGYKNLYEDKRMDFI